MKNGWKVFWMAYSGIDYQIGDTAMDEAEARKEAAKVIRARRRTGHTVNPIGKTRWEIQHREEGGMVLDTEGYLSLHEPRMFSCRECGMNHAPEEYSGHATFWAVCDSCTNPEPCEDEEAIVTW